MAGSSARTAVFYHIPEDGDDARTPNVFSIGRASNAVRLGDVKKTFPLPGAYHFRFKKAFKSTFVWLDVLDDFDVVPMFDGAIVAKVSRLRLPCETRHRATRHGRSNQNAGSHSPSIPHSNSASNVARSDGAHSCTNSSSSSSTNSIVSSSHSKDHTLDTVTSSSDLLGLHSPTHDTPVSAPAMSKTPTIKATPTMAMPTSAGGLVPPPAAAAMRQQSGGGQADKMMDLDWSTPNPSPSPSPSPPPVTTPASLSPMKARQGIGAISTNRGGIALRNDRSVSPIKTSRRSSKQNLQVPTDLSSAAKDFKL